MRRVDAVWLTLWAVAGVGFYVADRRGVALCVSARRVFRLDTPGGRTVFSATYATGAVVLHQHINKPGGQPKETA